MSFWLRNPDAGGEEVFVLGELVGDPALAEGGEVTVRLRNKKEVIVHSSELFTANPDGLTMPDNTMLIHLSEATLLQNVRARYTAKEIYTLTGTILLAMNPFEALPIYSEELMTNYKGKSLGREAPHVYGISEVAFQRLAKTGQSQSIIVSGESGAGKTETNKHLMQYLTWRSCSGGGVSSLAEAILKSNPVLEAFGNAKTSRNNNSSRFGKFIKILIDDKGNIVGARVASYLLEKSRVVSVAEGERNYHVLYHLAKGGPGPLLSALDLKADPKAYRYLSFSSVTELSSMPDGPMMTELTTALTACGVNETSQSHLFACLGGILHLGNLTFTGEEEAKIAAADALASMNKCFATDLSKCLTTRSMTVAGETTVVPLTPEKATYARDALGKAVYVRLFECIVSAVNTTLSLGAADDGAPGGPKFVGLLDVFGFEFFGTDNSFEQLAINFANEKLQQFFLRFVFRAEEDECVCRAAHAASSSLLS